jgi:hypothetical protein
VDIFDDNPPTQQEVLLARAAALRGQQAPQDPASRQRALGLLMQMSGNKAIGGAGEGFVGDAQRQAALAQQAPLVQAETAQKQYGITPQASLGGVAPNAYELLTKREQVPKYTSDFMGRIYNQRTGQVVQGSGGTGQMISPEAIDQAAHAYLQTQQLPNFGRANPLIHGQIIKRAAELDPNASLTGNKASYKADTGSLAGQQKILDNAESWERTGKANLDVLLGVAQKLKDTGSPWLNSPVRRFMEKGVGDPNQTAFKAAHATVVNEYAKILSGAQGSGSVTEGARHEAESMLPLDATWEQLSAAAKVLDTDAGNRIGAARQQVGQIKGRLGGQPAAPTAAAPTGPQASPEDTQALAWLKANPQHPSAAKVAAKLKSKGLVP